MRGLWARMVAAITRTIHLNALYDFLMALAAWLDKGAQLQFHTITLAAAPGKQLTLYDASRLENGAVCWVSCVRAPFEWLSYLTTAEDQIMIVRPENVAPGAAGRWVRRDHADPSWKRKASWYIDPVNGHDEYDGSIAGQPLRTGLELDRRLGHFSGTMSGRVDIYVQGDCELRLFLVREPGALIYLHGARTPVTAGTIATYTAPVRTYGAAAKAQITSADIAAFQAKTRVRITAGARAGAVAWIDEDLGGGAATCSTWVIPAADPMQVTPTRATPEAADPIELYTVPTITNGPIVVQEQYTPGGTNGGILIEDLNLGKATATASRFSVLQLTNEDLWQFRWCDFTKVDLMGDRYVAIGCGVSGGPFYGWDGSMDFVGGIIWGELQVNRGFQVFPDLDCLVTGAGAITFNSYVGERGCLVSFGTCGIFKAAGNGLNMKSGTKVRCKTNWDSTHQLYGAVTAAGAFGVDIPSDACLTYDTNVPAISGGAGGGDFRLCGQVTLPPWDAPNHVFQAAAALSWANVVAALPGGFDHHCGDPGSGARVTRTAT
jgi:hypothetical protein